MRISARMSRLLAVAIGAGVTYAMAAAAISNDTQIEALLTGTAHQALFAVAFDGDTGLSVGAGGQIVASSDGGASWQMVTPVPTELSLFGVDLEQGRGIVVGQSGLILVRDAAGAWRKVESGAEQRLFGVDLNAAGIAVAVGGFGAILRSADGGQHWRSVAPSWSAEHAEQGAEPHLYGADVAADGVITVVGEFGLVLRSSDGGENWKTLHRGDASLFALDLRPDGVGYAVGQDGTILRTDDGGANWAELESGSKANLLGVSSSASGRVVVTAMRDMLASDDGRTWRKVQWGDFGSAWYSGVNLVGTGSSERALVVGHSGRIVRIGP